MIPIKLLRLVVFLIGSLVFLVFVFLIITVLTISELLQKDMSVDPIRHSKDGKVVDLNGFRADKTRGEP